MNIYCIRIDNNPVETDLSAHDALWISIVIVLIKKSVDI